MFSRSCSGRDRLGPFRLSDITWLTANTENPLAVGQYVNNCSNGTITSLLTHRRNGAIIRLNISIQICLYILYHEDYLFYIIIVCLQCCKCCDHWLSKYSFSFFCVELYSYLSERAANVCYQEYDVPEAFPLELRQYLPNVNYRHDTQRQEFKGCLK